MPVEWLQVLSHNTTKDKAGLLHRLKNEMTVSDVHDLLEYQEYENWQGYEEYMRQKRESK
jgi:hypothetical protein